MQREGSLVLSPEKPCTRRTTKTDYNLQKRAHIRGLQFYTFFGIIIGITRRMIDIGKKIMFYFLQNV
jgi:hypothetical protein